MSARLAALALALLALAAAAQGPAPEAPAAPEAPDTSGWVCRFCPFEDGGSGWLEPAAGFVSDRSIRFGDFTGLGDDGAFLALDGAWRYREAESASAWDLRVEHAGLDSGAIAASGGRQGQYRVSLDYALLEHLRADDARTPFGGDLNLGLPAGWTAAGSTGGMAALDASLRTFEVSQRRVRSALGAALTPRPALDLRFDWRRDAISGTGTVGGSFMTLASELPRPLDQTLDRVDASAAYRHARLGHVQLALGTSSFANDVGGLRWDNPYSGPTAAARDGLMAQAPDNRARQLSLAFGTAPQARVQLSGTIASGRMEQDQRFLPATLNPDEAVALPRASLDGRVETFRASARAGVPIGRAYRVTADVLRDERDNQTPVAAYTQVVMDTFTGDVRENAPFGYTRTRWRLGFERRANPRFGAGVEQDRRERRLFGTASTDERTFWGRLQWRPRPGAELRLKASTAERSGEEFSGAAGVPLQNALMRAFNTADRERDEFRADASLSRPGMVAAFNLAWADERYPDGAVGRTDGDDLGYGTDLMVQPRENLSVSAFASHLRQESGQAGSEAFGAPDWSAQVEDATDVGGVQVAWQGPRQLEIGAGYTVARSEGAISMLAGSGASGFPRLLTRWDDARVFARYPLRPGLSLRLDLVREVYDASDWGQVGPDTVPNVLLLGQGTQNGSVTAVLLAAHWQL
ncbi:MAG: MtrB/PioB family decaheme-associated outer membrane protein [Gammaproteobacteria bacterium]